MNANMTVTINATHRKISSQCALKGDDWSSESSISNRALRDCRECRWSLTHSLFACSAPYQVKSPVEGVGATIKQKPLDEDAMPLMTKASAWRELQQSVPSNWPCS